MSKIIKIPTGDYYLKVKENGNITFDTGSRVGETLVTGNFNVKGTDTLIESENVRIKDNLVTINNGEGGSAITLNEAGIEIDRGFTPNAKFIFKEDEYWLNPSTNTVDFGAFLFEVDNSLVGIKTKSITTNGENLYLISEGSAVVSVAGTENYELQVLDYSDPNRPPLDDDIIPNIKAVTDYTLSFFMNNFSHKIEDSDTRVEVKDFDTTGLPSKVEIVIDGNKRADYFDTYANLYNLHISSSGIENTNLNSNFNIFTTGDGSVSINSNLNLFRTPKPTNPDDGTKIYVNTIQEGGSGIFFIDQDSNHDELISRNRALVLSMLF
jgi:hypothetical protein